MAWSACAVVCYWCYTDRGGSSRLRNIEETEKAKRQVAEERKERKKVNTDEEHLVATRCTCLFDDAELWLMCVSLPAACEAKVGCGDLARGKVGGDGVATAGRA